jgi:hypothetical protein
LAAENDERMTGHVYVAPAALSRKYTSLENIFLMETLRMLVLIRHLFTRCFIVLMGDFSADGISCVHRSHCFTTCTGVIGRGAPGTRGAD